MTDVRGFELSLAESILRNEGFEVISEEVRSRGGVPGGLDKRVIRVRRNDDDNTVVLSYSVFKTRVC